MTTLAVIGGSGLQDMPGLEHKRDLPDSDADLGFGRPSAPITEGWLGATRVLFLPRHGRGHTTPPHRVNYRANLLALKVAGAEQVLSVSAVGSLREELRPGDVVVVDQFIDRTAARPRTYFEDDGIVVHVSFAEPIDPALASALLASTEAAGIRVHRGGTYVCIEGPQFSTRAESHLYRSWGADVVGMTNLPEARLARECELPYATMALVTDYDCWREDEASVTVDGVLAVLRQNIANAQRIVRDLVTRLPDAQLSPTARALDHAVLTSSDARAEVPPRLRPLLARASTR